MGTQVLSCLRILRNTIIIKRRPRTPTNIYDGTPCDNSIRLWAVKCIVTNSSIFAVGRVLDLLLLKYDFWKILNFCFSRIKSYFLVNIIAEFGWRAPLTHRIKLFAPECFTPETCSIPSKRDPSKLRYWKVSWILFY